VSFVCLLCGTRYDAHRAFCGRCWEAGRIIDVGTRPRAELDGEAEATTARAILKMTWSTVTSRRYPTLALGRGAFIVATGLPGQGKSSFVAGLLDGIDGPVALLSIEEPPGPTLAQRILRVGVRRDDFHIWGRMTVDQLAEKLRTTKAIALGVDSIQPAMLTVRDVRHLLAVIPTLACVAATAQVNGRNGAIAGVREVEHGADLVIDVAKMKWAIRKSRYQREDTPEAMGDVNIPSESLATPALETSP
jgi:predicted ATP-dependent serine protease